MARITLLTDFGTADGYVAAMKGVIAEIAPSVFMDDAAHDIAHGDILGAALALRRYWKVYPAGTIHLVVVDPGVGSARRALAICADGRYLVGPDNGVFSFVLSDASVSEVYSIATEHVASRTFHGRDVFAPTAARLAGGAKLPQLGERISDAVTIALPPAVATDQSVMGEIVHIDRFGNLISNIPREMLKPGQAARVAEKDLPIVGTYSDVESGELAALVNSDGVIEGARRDGSAARTLNVERGAPLELISE